MPKLALDYQISEDIMVYTSVARGYKAGGFSYAVHDPDLAAFDPEISTALELGIKNELPELGLRINAAVFYTRVDEYQDRVQLDPMTGANYEDNAIALVPEYDFGLFLEYRNSWGLFARGEIPHMGSMYLDRTNKQKQNTYTLLNMKIGYEQENWDIYLAA